MLLLHLNSTLTTRINFIAPAVIYVPCRWRIIYFIVVVITAAAAAAAAAAVIVRIWPLTTYRRDT